MEKDAGKRHKPCDRKDGVKRNQRCKELVTFSFSDQNNFIWILPLIIKFGD